MDVKEAGRLGAQATNKKLTKKQRQENARKGALKRWEIFFAKKKATAKATGKII